MYYEIYIHANEYIMYYFVISTHRLQQKHINLPEIFCAPLSAARFLCNNNKYFLIKYPQHAHKIIHVIIM